LRRRTGVSIWWLDYLWRVVTGVMSGRSLNRRCFTNIVVLLLNLPTFSGLTFLLRNSQTACDPPSDGMNCSYNSRLVLPSALQGSFLHLKCLPSTTDTNHYSRTINSYQLQSVTASRTNFLYRILLFATAQSQHSGRAKIRLDQQSRLDCALTTRSISALLVLKRE
ncbi:hypothetical protein T02_16469, partial [Trichinella nativa]